MDNGDPKTYARAKALSATIGGGEPLAWKEYPDGSMVIITESGQKHTFVPDAKPEPKFELTDDQPVKKKSTQRKVK